MVIGKLLTAAMLATGIAAFAAGSAYATPISGNIDVNGIETAHTTSSPWSISFQNSASVDVVSGSFTEIGTCTGCVTMAASFTNPPSTYAPPGFHLFSAMSNGDTVVLDVLSDQFSKLGANGIQIVGTGMVSLSGFDDTFASFSLTVPSGGKASFDLNTQVPEPGTLALFGAGLLGCAIFVGRRRRSMNGQV